MGKILLESYVVKDKRVCCQGDRLSVLYVEEGISQPGRHLLPLLAKDVSFHLVASVKDVDFAQQHGMPLLAFMPPRFPVQRAYASRRLALRMLKDHRIELIHGHSGTDFLLPQCVPTVTHVHGSCTTDWWRSWRLANPVRRLRHLVGYVHYVVPEKISIRKATHVIAVSETIRQEIINQYGFSPQDVTVVPNGVSETFFSADILKTPEDRARLLFVGRLHRSKSIVEFKQCFVKVSNLNVQFVVVGGGPEESTMARLATKDHRLVLTGTVPHEDVLKIAKTNIFVFPSYYEGFGLAVLEAMAAGHAVVARDIPAVREVVGDARILCRDVAQMIEAIRKLVADPEARFDLQLRARSRARLFSWERSARILLDIYRRVVNA